MLNNSPRPWNDIHLLGYFSEEKILFEVTSFNVRR